MIIPQQSSFFYISSCIKGIKVQEFIIQLKLQHIMQHNGLRNSLRRSIVQRRQSELLNYLVQEMAIDQQISKILIKMHDPSNISDILDLFLTDQNGLVNHVFIPQESKDNLCSVCQGHIDIHRIVDSQMGNPWQNHKENQEHLIQSFQEKGQDQTRHTCQICCLEVVKSDILVINDQFHNICLVCVESYIKQEVNSMRIERIGCPHCNWPFSIALIQQLTDAKTFNKYKMFLRNIEIQKNPNLKWCPNPKCSVIISTNSKSKTTKCPKCSTSICNKCNRQAHPSQSCHKAFQKEIKDWQNASDIQKCKKCQGIVQKIAGCNHMTCSICHYEWCWLCGSSYTAGHFSSINPFGCPGLQDQQRDEWGKQKICLLRFGLLLLIIIGFPILFPLALLACGPVLIGNIIWNHFYPQNCCKKCLIIIISIIFGTIINPIVWVGGLFYFVPKGIKKLITMNRQRRETNLSNSNYLRNRLLNEQNIEEIIVSE